MRWRGITDCLRDMRLYETLVGNVCRCVKLWTQTCAQGAEIITSYSLWRLFISGAVNITVIISFISLRFPLWSQYLSHYLFLLPLLLLVSRVRFLSLKGIDVIDVLLRILHHFIVIVSSESCPSVCCLANICERFCVHVWILCVCVHWICFLRTYMRLFFFYDVAYHWPWYCFSSNITHPCTSHLY